MGRKYSFYALYLCLLAFVLKTIKADETTCFYYYIKTIRIFLYLFYSQCPNLIKK